MNILVVDFERGAQANAIAEVLYRGGHNSLPVYSQQEALGQIEPLGVGRPFRPEKFFFEIAVLCTIRPHLEAIRFADRIRELLPGCKIVVLDFYEDTDFLWSLRSDFSYLPLPMHVNDFLRLVGELKIQIDRDLQEMLDSVFGPKNE
jgi:hypothetical protein